MENRPRTVQVALFVMVLCFGCGNRSQAVIPQQDLSLELLASGDLICRLGNGHLSGFFQQVSQRDARFSHAGIVYISDELEGQIFIIHAEADEAADVGGVLLEPLDAFLQQSVNWSIFRIATTSEKRRIIAKRAYLHYQLKTPFDLAFNAADTSAFYCTELVAHCVN